MAKKADAVAVVVALCAASTLLSSTTRADEGQWTPSDLASLDQGTLRARGLELSASQLYNEQDGGLLRAAINYGGCSASFVSSDGLIVTNHHCAHSDLQAQSTPEHNLLRDGLLTKTRAEELPAKNRGGVQVLEGIDDVTAEIHSAISDGKLSDRERHLAIERARKQLVDKCEKRAARRCYVRSFFGGSFYRLFTTVELSDVRLVFAPPESLGNFGGEIDNWMWPRHTADFTFLRAYVAPDGSPAEYHPDNVPYHPPRWLRVSPTGVPEPGHLIAVMGYPGKTQRHLPAIEAQRHVEQVLPSTIRLYGEWMALLDSQAGLSEAVAIKVASKKRWLANRHKNARGMLEGIKRMKLLERKRARDAHIVAAAKRQGGPAAKVMAKIQKLSQQRRAAFEREFLLRASTQGPSLLSAAIDAVRYQREQKKPDLERRSAFMTRNEAKLRRGIARKLRDYDPDVETQLIASLVDHASALSVPIDAYAALTRDAREAERSLPDWIRDQLRGSKLAAMTPEELLEAARLAAHPGQEPAEKEDAAKEDAAGDGHGGAAHDAILALAASLTTDLEALDVEGERRAGMATRVMPTYFRLLQRQAPIGKPLYPDANRSLRISFASVIGYSPQDGLWSAPQTSVAGTLAKWVKHKGEKPFHLPERVRAAAANADASYWAAPHLGTVPACFLANADTTGGNSGSAAVNGRGELVGINFDRVWENIAGDFGYNPKQSRNILVDIRYVLWLLQVYDANQLLEELGVAQFTDAPPRRLDDAPRPPARNRVGCHVSRTPASPSTSLLWLSVLALAACRRKRRRSEWVASTIRRR